MGYEGSGRWGKGRGMFGCSFLKQTGGNMKKTVLLLIGVVIGIPVIAFAANGQPFQDLQNQIQNLQNQVNQLNTKLQDIQLTPGPPGPAGPPGVANGITSVYFGQFNWGADPYSPNSAWPPGQTVETYGPCTTDLTANKISCTFLVMLPTCIPGQNCFFTEGGGAVYCTASYSSADNPLQYAPVVGYDPPSTSGCPSIGGCVYVRVSSDADCTYHQYHAAYTCVSNAAIQFICVQGEE